MLYYKLSVNIKTGAPHTWICRNWKLSTQSVPKPKKQRDHPHWEKKVVVILPEGRVNC